MLLMRGKKIKILKYVVLQRVPVIQTCLLSYLLKKKQKVSAKYQAGDCVIELNICSTAENRMCN